MDQYKNIDGTGNVYSTRCHKHVCDHHDAVKRIKISLKLRRHAFPPIRFAVEHKIEDALFCEVASRVAEDMVAELTLHAAANVV